MRTGSVSTLGLPVVVPGRDPLPTACGQCGSHAIETTPPLGPDRYGLATCWLCGEALAWIESPLPPIGRAALRTLPAGSPSPAPFRPRQRIRSAASARRASCGRTCTAAYGCDPDHHEAVGADRVYAEFAERARGTVETGPLVIALDGSACTLAGAPLVLIGLERDLLLHLARQLGEVCSHRAILAAVWGSATAAAAAAATGPEGSERRLLRQKLACLRAHLGPHRDLIETVTGRGYRLRAMPPWRDDDD